METEFKFALSPEARRAIEGYLLVHGEDAAVDSHIDRTTYFDTADLALLRTALSVRIRHRVDDGANGGGTYVQTVKARGNGWACAARNGNGRSPAPISIASDSKRCPVSCRC